MRRLLWPSLLLLVSAIFLAAAGYAQSRMLVMDGNADHAATPPLTHPVNGAQDEAQAAERRAEGPPAPVTTAPDDDLEVLFWQTALKYDQVDDYQAYLKRYPNGAFATLANDRIAVLSGASRPLPASTPAPNPTATPTRTLAPVDDASDADATMWRTAEAANSASAYYEYLTRYPDGKFSTQASQRIASLSGAPIKDEQIAPVPAQLSPKPVRKSASAVPETPPKPAPHIAIAPVRPAPPIVKPAVRAPREPVVRPARQAEAPAPSRAPASENSEQTSSDGCPPHYFSHVFPSATGYRCMPYP